MGQSQDSHIEGTSLLMKETKFLWSDLFCSNRGGLAPLAPPPPLNSSLFVGHMKLDRTPLLSPSLQLTFSLPFFISKKITSTCTRKTLLA